jgi:PhzF family phenazine biosynthesis protein
VGAYDGLAAVLVHVDAFTERPFAGNPAAVCTLAGPADEAWIAMAGEMNLAATVFVWPMAEGFSLRWFSPTSELTLCGHGTLASGHVLLEDGHAPGNGEIRFHTRAGPLVTSRQAERIELDFPAEPSTPAEAPQALLRAVDQLPVRIERNRLRLPGGAPIGGRGARGPARL